MDALRWTVALLAAIALLAPVESVLAQTTASVRGAVAARNPVLPGVAVSRQVTPSVELPVTSADAVVPPPLQDAPVVPLARPAALDATLPGVSPGSPPPNVETTRVLGNGPAPLGSSIAARGTRVAGPVSSVEIARSFLAADLNQDGELTREEARLLTISAGTFDDMDANHDGVITRFEYEDALGR